jgi:endogenous inhibitor of DNA gyrase (YacG/DUF329 family)
MKKCPNCHHVRAWWLKFCPFCLYPWRVIELGYEQRKRK